MARLSGVDLPREKRVEIALTYVFGIGRSRSQEILKNTGVNPDTRVRDLAEASLRLCDNGRAEYVKNATHWVQHDEPERCREFLLEFLKGASVTRTLIFETGDGKSPASNSQ